MFVLQNFMNQVRQDNPHYERHVRSSLHDLVAVLSRTARPFTALEVATELKKIMRAEPTKLATRYARSKAYLLREIPGLAAALRGEITDFRTGRISKGNNGTIVHQLVWGSDTGSLADLAHLRVRELVSWPTPAHPVVPATHIIAPEPLENYRVAGQHAGVGNAAFTPGSTGQGNDTHSAIGPFSPGALAYAGATPLVVTFDQVYQYSSDGGVTWQDIQDSRYSIRRELRPMGGRTQVTLTKTNVTRPRDSLSNVLTL